MCGTLGSISEGIIERAHEFTGIKKENILVCATHLLTGGPTLPDTYIETDQPYIEMLIHLAADAITLANLRLKPVCAKYAQGSVNSIAFVRFCAKELNADERCILEGMSCGGLQAACFAELYPELSAVMYLDAPVLNILSMVGLGECDKTNVDCFWREIVATFGVNKSTIVNFRKSPIDNMKPLIDNNIPVIMLYGNADGVVVYEENGKVLEDFYKENGGIIKVISKSMCGHHPHCLDDPEVIVEFVEKYFANI